MPQQQKQKPSTSTSTTDQSERPQSTASQLPQLPSPDTSEAQAKVEATDELIEEIDRIIEEAHIELADDEAQDDGPRTLADFMRIGAGKGPQAFNTYGTPRGETCALGAAYEGLREAGLA